MKRSIETLVAAALLLGGALYGQEPPKAPAAQEGEKKQDLEATIVAFKGTVDVKRPEDKDWVPAERNMKLKKGSEVCTAVASSAKLLFTGSIQIDVKALTQAKIDDLAKTGAKVNADVKLKFGAVEVDIQKSDLKADMKVTAPNSTTSVSGSHGIVKAPASGGGARITLSTTSGSWKRHLDKLDLDKDFEGSGKGNENGDLPQDLNYRFATDKFLNYFGKSKDELFQNKFTGKAGDIHPWDIPLGEFGGTGPSSPKHKKPGALPLPPGTP
jgi:FecR-like protein